jgi:phosphoglycerate dehydrogenase-like enzyme
VLANLPADAVFCNVGRGALVHEPSLWALVENKRLRLASDVFEREPVPSASHWLRQQRALLSPHIGGPTQDSYPECGAFALRNVRRFIAGHRLEAVITPAIFARST